MNESRNKEKRYKNMLQQPRRLVDKLDTDYEKMGLGFLLKRRRNNLSSVISRPWDLALAFRG